jgi:class 3 adenylate cyclase
MVVSQADWHREAELGKQRTTFVQAHAWDFLRACENVVLRARRQLAQDSLPLAIGCGIACGELDRVFLFGRFDFLGSAANEAAKLQQHAWNEICATNEVRTILESDGRSSTGDWPLASKGWRLRTNAISDAQPSAAADAQEPVRR